MDLHLNLKKEYFNEIKNGTKKIEYRLKNQYWSKRLKNKEFDKVYIKLGYPKSNQKEKILCFKLLKIEEQKISHKEFGNFPIEVYAIFLGDEISL